MSRRTTVRTENPQTYQTRKHRALANYGTTLPIDARKRVLSLETPIVLPEVVEVNDSSSDAIARSVRKIKRKIKPGITVSAENAVIAHAREQIIPNDDLMEIDESEKTRRHAKIKNGNDAFFIVKDSIGVTEYYSNKVLRYLCAGKRCAGRRVAFVNNKHTGEIKFAVKWHDDVMPLFKEEKQRYNDGSTVKTRSIHNLTIEDHELEKGLAYQLGVLAVLSEPDGNPANFLYGTDQDGKLKIYRIDYTGALRRTNIYSRFGYPIAHSGRVFGCAQSNDFLHKLAGIEKSSTVYRLNSKLTKANQLINDAFSEYQSALFGRGYSEDEEFQLFQDDLASAKRDGSISEEVYDALITMTIDEYKNQKIDRVIADYKCKISTAIFTKGIDGNLFDRIRKNISYKEESLEYDGRKKNRELFMEFMEGLIATIDLIDECTFLDTMQIKTVEETSPYRYGVDDQITRLRDALNENADEARTLYGRLIEFYYELHETRDRSDSISTVTYNIGSPSSTTLGSSPSSIVASPNGKRSLTPPEKSLSQ